MTRLAEWRLIAVGRMGRGPEAELVNRYLTRLRPALTLVELADGRGASGEIKRREGEAILQALPGNAFLVILDPGPAAPSSEGLAVLVQSWLELGRPVAFVIGGAEGLDQAVRSRAQHALSLGPLTWPHLLARVMLVEQLYRARSITLGHPYHRG